MSQLVIKKYYVSFSFVLVAILILLFGWSGVASAHVLKENNGVAAVLHIPPDDNPVAARPTSLDLSFNSDSGNFSLKDCNCQVTVQSNGKTIQKVPLKQPAAAGSLTTTAVVTFQTIGVYDVLVSGTSKTGTFPSFRLDYLERVATTANAPKSNNGELVVLLGGASFILLAMVGYAAVDNGGRYKKIKKAK